MKPDCWSESTSNGCCCDSPLDTPIVSLTGVGMESTPINTETMVKSSPPLMPKNSKNSLNDPESIKQKQQSPQSSQSIKSKPHSFFGPTFRSAGLSSGWHHLPKRDNNPTIRRCDSSSVVTRSISSAGSSSVAQHGTSSSDSDNIISSQSHQIRQHRPSCPSSNIQSDLQKMELFLQKYKHNSQDEVDNLQSPIQKKMAPPEIVEHPATPLPVSSSIYPKSQLPHNSSSPTFMASSPPTPPLISQNDPSNTSEVTLRRPNSFGRLSNSFSGGPGKGGQQILKYSKKRLRGPYGEMLESKMRCSDQSAYYPYECNENIDTGYSLCNRNSVIGIYDSTIPKGEHNTLSNRTPLSFTDELLRQTRSHRTRLDENSKETIGTARSTLEEPLNNSSLDDQQQCGEYILENV